MGHISGLPRQDFGSRLYNTVTAVPEDDELKFFLFIKYSIRSEIIFLVSGDWYASDMQ